MATVKRPSRSDGPSTGPPLHAHLHQDGTRHEINNIFCHCQHIQGQKTGYSTGSIANKGFRAPAIIAATAIQSQRNSRRAQNGLQMSNGHTQGMVDMVVSAKAPPLVVALAIHASMALSEGVAGATTAV